MSFGFPSVLGGGVGGSGSLASSPYISRTDIGAFSTPYALSINNHYQGTIAAARTITFSGSPVEGSTISLKLLCTTECVLTVPSCKPLGGANTATTTVTVKPIGNHMFSWLYIKSEWVMTHTADGDWDQSENTTIDLEDAPSADGKYTGLAIDGTAGTALAFGDCIVLDVTDSRWELADANSAAAADGDCRGLAGFCVLAAAADGNATKVLMYGTIRADAKFPTLTVGAPAWVSETGGAIVTTAPTTANAVQRVMGFGIDGNTLFVCPSSLYVEVT